MTKIENILNESGPLMSSELARRLEKKDSISYNTASQRIVRNKKIHKIKGFFKSGQSLCYLETQEYDELYEKLNFNLFEYGRKYWYCLNAIKLNGGAIERKHLECLTNYPVLPLKKHLPFNKVMQVFVREGVLVFDSDYYYLSSRFGQKRISKLTQSTLDLIKSDLLNSFERLTKNIGLVSYKTPEFFAEYGKFRWAFKGVSNVTGLISDRKSGFLLADIIIGKPIFKDDVRFFVEKINHIQSFNNASKLLPFLIVDDLDKEALIYLKKHGIVVGLIGELFGEKYALALKELITILENTGASLKNNPDKYLDLIKELKKYNEGLVNNIRGTFFEFMVGHIHSVNSNSSIKLGKIVFDRGKQHEMDVMAVYPDKVIIVECKATKSKVSKSYVDKWLGVKIPAFKKYLEGQDAYQNKNIVFEIWSINGFTEDALIKLNSIAKKTTKYKIIYLESKEIRNKALEMKNKKLKEALDEYFLKIKV